MRLIHYSTKPLTKVRSRKNFEGAGAYKTPGLWVSVEGDDDWPAWCKGEGFGLDGFTYATEVVLADDANVKHVSGATALDDFTEEFSVRQHGGPIWHRGLNWNAIRKRWRGLIIAPYCWERRLVTGWYYSWNCASGVIWDAKAIKELRQTTPPDMKAEAA